VLEPGGNFIILFLDRVSHRISNLEPQLPSFSQNARTEDDALIKIAISLINRIKKLEKTALKATNVDAAIANTVADILRAEISEIQANQIQSSRGALGASVKQQLLAISNEWGIEITRVNAWTTS
jgi:hypothetical protein